MEIILFILFLSISNIVTSPVNTTAEINSIINNLNDEIYSEISDNLSYFKDLFNTEPIETTEPAGNEINKLGITKTTPVSGSVEEMLTSEINLSTSTIEITTFNPDANEISDSKSYESTTISNNVARVIYDVMEEAVNTRLVQNSSSVSYINFKLSFFLEFLLFINVIIFK